MLTLVLATRDLSDVPLHGAEFTPGDLAPT
jgi:hypothetical protein